MKITEDTATGDLSGLRDEFDTYLLEAGEVIEKMADFDSISQGEWRELFVEYQEALDIVYSATVELKGKAR